MSGRTRKTLATLAVLMALLVSLFGTVAAQDGTTTPEPTSGDTEETTSQFTHPIVQILSAYFGRNSEDVTEPTDPTEPTDTVTPDPNDPTTPDGEDHQQTLAEQIAAYHEQGMGFGVLVKLYAMAEAQKEACPTDPGTGDTGGDTTGGDTTGGDTTTTADEGTGDGCTAVTVDELVNQFKSGSGMGQLFKQYGKPALLGVGHVKQAMKKAAADGNQDTTTITAQDDTSKQPKKAANPGKGSGKGKGPKK